MKKIILVIPMIIVIVTPCFTQEIEPKGIFSLHGTLWNFEPTWDTGLYGTEYYLGFHQGNVYFAVTDSFNEPSDFSIIDNAMYLNFIAFSIFFMRDEYQISGILYPAIGVGLGTSPSPSLAILFIKKVSNKFEPNLSP